MTLKLDFLGHLCRADFAILAIFQGWLYFCKEEIFLTWSKGNWSSQTALNTQFHLSSQTILTNYKGQTTGWPAGEGDECNNDKDDVYSGSEEGNNTDRNAYDNYNDANSDSDDTHVHSYLCIEQCPLEDKMLPSAKFWIIGFRQPYSEEIVVM